MKQIHDYLGSSDDPKNALKGQVLMLQLKGAGYAAAFCLAIVLGILAIAWIGRALPEASRDTQDPTPYSFDLTVETAQVV